MGLRARHNHGADLHATLLTEAFTAGNVSVTDRGWMNAYVVEQILQGYKLPIPPECPDEGQDLALNVKTPQ